MNDRTALRGSPVPMFRGHPAPWPSGRVVYGFCRDGLAVCCQMRLILPWNTCARPGASGSPRCLSWSPRLMPRGSCQRVCDCKSGGNLRC